MTIETKINLNGLKTAEDSKNDKGIKADVVPRSEAKVKAYVSVNFSNIPPKT